MKSVGVVLEEMEHTVARIEPMGKRRAEFHGVWYDFEAKEFCTKFLLEHDLKTPEGVVAARLAFYRIMLQISQWVQDLDKMEPQSYPIKTQLQTLRATTATTGRKLDIKDSKNASKNSERQQPSSNAVLSDVIDAISGKREMDSYITAKSTRYFGSVRDGLE